MDDTINRRLAIKTALEFFVEFFGGAFREDDQRLLAERIEALPSAQPETNCSEIPNNSDLISRQAAIEALQGRK